MGMEACASTAQEIPPAEEIEEKESEFENENENENENEEHEEDEEHEEEVAYFEDLQTLKDLEPLTKEEKEQFKQESCRYILTRKHGGSRREHIKQLSEAFGPYGFFRFKKFHKFGLHSDIFGDPRTGSGFGDPPPFIDPFRPFGYPHGFDPYSHGFGGPFGGFRMCSTFGHPCHEFRGFGGPCGSSKKCHKFSGRCNCGKHCYKSGPADARVRASESTPTPTPTPTPMPTIRSGSRSESRPVEIPPE
jgi:hypothetical protein